METTPIKTNRELVKSVWKQTDRNAKEIPLRFCERYVSIL